MYLLLSNKTITSYLCYSSHWINFHIRYYYSSLFGSSSDVHEFLVEWIDLIEEFKDNPIPSSSYKGLYSIINSYYADDFSMSSQDAKSIAAIQLLNYQFLKGKSYGVIKSLKGIDDS